MSQIARRSTDGRGRFVWNFPLDLTLRSTNPHGWPRLVVSVYGLDGLGRDVVRGYGAAPVPVAPGPQALRIAMFVPQSSTLLLRATSWFTGQRPEFVDPKFVAQSVGREGRAAFAAPPRSH